MSHPILATSDTLRVYDDILQAIGRTPLVHLNHLGASLACSLYAKVEFFNPGGSVKDRIAVNIIEEAERNGRLKPGGTVVEATSGNTGLGLAMVCAKKGYKAIFVLPDKMSQEKVQLLRAFGARVIITPTEVPPDDPRSNISVAMRLSQETPNIILANQYHNPENPRSHYLTTGPEIWQQTGGKVTDVVMGMGTGGTISGTGRYLKEQNPAIRIVGVDPAGSLLLETWQLGRLPQDVQAKAYKVEGIGEDFVPTTLDLPLLDEVIRVGDKESFLWARRLVKEEGIFCGGSSGAALAAAMQYAVNLPPERLVVVLLPDSGSRYLSKFYDDKWMRENGFLEADWCEASLNEVLEAKPMPGLVIAHESDRMGEVIAAMRAHDISQMPVVHSDETLAGLVTEIDMLKYLVDDNHGPDGNQTIAEVMQPAQNIFSPDTQVETVLPVIMENQVVLVAEEGHPVGILTKVDLLDFITHGM
ncbi:MAG: cystathionine beta-synthase [Acidobacteriaceae bacterium]